MKLPGQPVVKDVNRISLERHKVSRDQIKAIQNHVLVHKMSFDRRITNTGLILPGDNGTGAGIYPRWGCVYAVGKNQKDVQVGQWIMVEHGRWTRGLEIEDEEGEHTIRRVDPECIIMVADSEEEIKNVVGVSTSTHVQKKEMA